MNQNSSESSKEVNKSHCCPEDNVKGPRWMSWDKILWPSLILVVLFYSASFISLELPWLQKAAHHTRELVHSMWWGVLMGVVFIGLVGGLSAQKLSGFLSGSSGFSGILKATIAGVLLDLCSHGILMVGMRVYKGGASLGQIMAFLIASPWNSLSLTFVLFGLIGIPWTLAIVGLSFLIALVSGLIFDLAVKKGLLPSNPYREEGLETVSFKTLLKSFRWPGVRALVRDGIMESQMVIRWLLFGIVIAVFVQMILTDNQFQQFFGPTFLGLLATVGLATIIEVCSEGSAPLASQFLTKAAAPGNTFAYLMTGVSTDYTEIMAIKDTTKSWKVAFALPIITLPQIILISYLLNAV